MSLLTCPKCDASTRVLDSRPVRRGRAYRRRECENPKCRQRFTTAELYIADPAADDADKVEREELRKAAESIKAQADQVLTTLSKSETL